MLLSTRNEVACRGPDRCSRIKDFRRGERSASLVVLSTGLTPRKQEIDCGEASRKSPFYS